VIEMLGKENPKLLLLRCDQTLQSIEMPWVKKDMVHLDKGPLDPHRGTGYPRLYVKWTERAKMEEASEKFETIRKFLRYFIEYYEGDEYKDEPGVSVPFVEAIGLEVLPNKKRKQIFYYKGICRQIVYSPARLDPDTPYNEMDVSIELFTVIKAKENEGKVQDADDVDSLSETPE